MTILQQQESAGDGCTQRRALNVSLACSHEENIQEIKRKVMEGSPTSEEAQIRLKGTLILLLKGGYRKLYFSVKNTKYDHICTQLKMICHEISPPLMTFTRMLLNKCIHSFHCLVLCMRTCNISTFLQETKYIFPLCAHFNILLSDECILSFLLCLQY